MTWIKSPTLAIKEGAFSIFSAIITRNDPIFSPFVKDLYTIIESALNDPQSERCREYGLDILVQVLSLIPKRNPMLRPFKKFASTALTVCISFKSLSIYLFQYVLQFSPLVSLFVFSFVLTFLIVHKRILSDSHWIPFQCSIRECSAPGATAS